MKSIEQKQKKRDELKQLRVTLGTFSAVTLDLLWKSADSVSSKLKKCVQYAGSFVEISH
jgi:hypothetical protein